MLGINPKVLDGSGDLANFSKQFIIIDFNYRNCISITFLRHLISSLILAAGWTKIRISHDSQSKAGGS